MPTTIDIEVTGSELIDVTVNTVVNTVEIDMQPATNVIEIDFANTVPGPAGPAGTDGSVWHRGTGAPSDLVGADGDYYIDDSAGVWYGPKAAGTWTGTGPNAFGVGVTDHGSLTGLGDDDHTQYSLADGTRWTGTPTANRLVRSDASGNLIVSEISDDGTNIAIAAGDNLKIPAAPSYLWVGDSLVQSGVLSYAAGSPNIFTIGANLAQLKLIGANSMTLQAGGGDEFVWPTTDGSAGHVMKTDGAGELALADVMTLVTAASDTAAGKVELATTAETDTGTDSGRAVTPDGLAGSYAGTKSVSAYVVAAGTAVSTGDGKAYLTIPDALAGMNLVAVHARVITAGTTGTTDIQIHNVTQAADMLTTKITIDSAETGSDTAAAAAVIDTANDDVAAYDLLRIDVDAVSTTAPQGLIVTLEFRLP